METFESQNSFQIWIVEHVTSFPKCPRTLQDHLWLGRIEEMKMAIYHFCARHFHNVTSCKSVSNMLVLGFTGPNPFYTPKLNANTLDIGFILIFETLHNELIQKWHKVHIATLIKHAFCNFVILEPWT